MADAFGIPVIAGPTEATALGNASLHLVGLGELHTLAEIRAVAQRAQTEIVEPQAGRRAVWDEAAGRSAALTATRER